MIEWCIKYWNILAGLALFGIAIFVLNRDCKKLQKKALEARSNQYPNQLPERNPTILEAHVKYGYTLKEIAAHLEVHYTTVSKVIKAETLKK